MRHTFMAVLHILESLRMLIFVYLILDLLWYIAQINCIDWLKEIVHLFDLYVEVYLIIDHSNAILYLLIIA